MSRPFAKRRAIGLIVLVSLAAALFLWRSIAISDATAQLQDQMKTGALGLIDKRFNGADGERDFIRRVIQSNHLNAFERCEVVSSFWPVGTSRGRKSGAEVSVNLNQYLTSLCDEVLSAAQREGKEIDHAALKHALLTSE